MIHIIPENLEKTLDITSIVVVIGTVASWLPPIAALLSIIWTALRIYEMISGKTIAERRKEKRK